MKFVRLLAVGTLVMGEVAPLLDASLSVPSSSIGNPLLVLNFHSLHIFLADISGRILLLYKFYIILY